MAENDSLTPPVRPSVKPNVCISSSLLFDLVYSSRYKPNDLDQMSLETKFSKAEVKFLYRAFKTECPNGIIDEETFKDVYEKIFPMGDASKYAQIVFRAIDRDRTGGITFGDFMDFLSVISKGSDQEKILWSFQFFDVNQDGKITREEMIKVTARFIGESSSRWNLCPSHRKH